MEYMMALSLHEDPLSSKIETRSKSVRKKLHGSPLEVASAIPNLNTWETSREPVAQMVAVRRTSRTCQETQSSL